MKCKCGKEYIKNSSYMCLDCRRAYNAIWRKKRKDLGLPTGGSKMPLEWFREYWKKYAKNPEVKRRRAELAKKYRNDPEKRYKHFARWAVSHAISSGKLVKSPCAVCGELKTEAHHKDYAKPLEVIWLCRKCHIKEHTKAEGK